MRPPARPLWGPPSQMCLPGPLPGLLCEYDGLATPGPGTSGFSGEEGSAVPQILPHKPGPDPRLGRLFTPPIPQELVGSGLATVTQTPAPPGTPPPQREHHPWAAEAPRLILEPQAFRAEFCWGGGAWPLLQRLLLRCWLAAPTALWLCVVMKPLEIKATLPGSFAAR